VHGGERIVKIAVEGSAEPLELAGDDSVRPFAVEALDVRGRAIQMGAALDEILSRHDYPAPVSRLLAEAVVLTVLLGSLLRNEGKLILQAQTDGPVDLLVVDYRAGGAVRGYARFDAEAVAKIADRAGRADVGALLGEGTLAMTIDRGTANSRYQGVVPLDGASLEEVAHTYFRQSEQIPTRVRLAVAEAQTREKGKIRRHWRAGGVIVQFLPDKLERMKQPDLPGGDAPAGIELKKTEEEVDDAWREATAHVDTIGDDELIDPDVPVERLLYRLFHERGVRVFKPDPIRSECSCSRDRVSSVLTTFTPQEIAESTEDGAITVTCEFCGTKYLFDPDEFTTEPADHG
jgi:molecular chaperone Hsp33